MKLKRIIEKQAEQHDSFYLYDERCILESIECLKSNFPQIDFLYSIKCNPNPHVLHSIFAQGFGADAASLGEVLLASDAGLSRNQIYYSAPGKTLKDIEGSIAKAILIADSIDEIKRIQKVAEEMEIVTEIGVRINPDFTFYDDCGQASKFGIDEASALDFIQNNSCENVKITGIHVHLRSQELKADVLSAYYRKMLRLAEKFQRICGGLKYVNMGSGMGIRYSEKDSDLDLSLLSDAMKEAFTGFWTSYPNTKIMIEVGRYVACKCGIYVTKVLERKLSYGKTYLILKNTLNGFARPSLARLVMSYSSDEMPAGSEPLFTCEDAFEFLTLKEDAPVEMVSLVGNLCTTTDIVAELMMPYLECGDLIIITNAGSYGAVLSPMQFSGMERPAELFLTVDGELL